MTTYPDGTLLRASGPEVDRMDGGQRRWIPDPSTFNCMKLDWGAIQTISDSEWNQIPQGVAYPSRVDGTLLQGSGPQIYVMAGCQRRYIPDPETFNALGYSWSAVVHVSDADLNAIAQGKQIPHQEPSPIAGKSWWLAPGAFLGKDDYLVSKNAQFVARMQFDGNFVIYDCSGGDPTTASAAIWASNTVQSEDSLYTSFFATMQTDGNFVIYRGSGPDNIYGGAAKGFVWASGTTMGQCFAILQDDGNFVIYQGTDPDHQGAFCWNSGPANITITVKNQGAYVARYSSSCILWGSAGVPVSVTLNAGQSYTDRFNAGCTNVEIKCESETGLVWDPWKTIFDVTYSIPPNKAFTLTGTTLNPSYNES